MNRPQQFRKKPVVIEAILWNGDNIMAVTEFMAPDAAPIYMPGFKNSDELIGIDTLGGCTVAQKGDWIIKGVKGEFYPCKPDIFERTHDPVSVGVAKECSVCRGSGIAGYVGGDDDEIEACWKCMGGGK